MKKYILIIIAAAVILLSFSIFIVHQNEFVIKARFGKVVSIIKIPGLYFKMPFTIDKTYRLTSKVQSFESDVIQLLLSDRNPIVISSYICWKIEDPLLFYQRFGNVKTGQNKISEQINSRMGAILADYTLDDIINPDASKVKLQHIEDRLIEESNQFLAGNYGIKIIQTGIIRFSYPEIVSEAVYQRMQAEREKEAAKYRAEGRQKAEEIRAKTDREVSEILSEAYRKSEEIKSLGDKEALNTYLKAYKKDPEFFKFLQSIDAYNNIFDNKTTVVLSKSDPIFKYLTPPGAVK